MVTDTYSKMISEISMRSMMKNEESIYRSGSAPPTVEGSLSAVGGLFNGLATDEDLRSDPTYVNYYYSNLNLNPRLPPPLISKEDWRFSQRLHGGGGGGGGGAGGGGGGGANRAASLFSVQPGSGGKVTEAEEEEASHAAEWGGGGLIGLTGLGLGARQKSISEIFKDDMNQANKAISRQPSRPVSRNAFDEIVEASDAQFGHLRSSAASHSYASALGTSLSRSTTPDPQLIARAPSPRIPTAGVGRTAATTIDHRRTVNGQSSFNLGEADDLVSALSGMNLHSTKAPYQSLENLNSPTLNGRSGSSSNHYPNYGMSSGYGMSPPSPMGGGNLPPLFESAAAAFGGGLGLGPSMLDLAAAAELQNSGGGRFGNLPPVDPMYLQYLRMSNNEYLNEADLYGLQKAYLNSLLSSQKSNFGGVPYMGKSNGLSHGYYGNHGYGLGMSYPGSPIGGGALLPGSPVGSGGSPVRHVDRNLRFSSGMRNMTGLVGGGWGTESGGNFDESFASSLLDEFKSNKAKCFELTEIAGHVVEFSADQYGSRFIQQKLETATIEEKNMVFNEIMPQGLSLMTDVFGNYVIQKFFEHGTAPQIRELADQLTGHVLTLSLQMYGCRVIQKAIEVVEFDQQTQMVMELDGHIMRCVRDQNGNHVIQKCIECVPEDAIQFIVSTFYDQVVTLSTHPYGCRVIQRVLEHCNDPKTQRIMMDEILLSVCMLAQDQYGNYVVQHVLEHGKPHERTAIIKKLTGQIVQMSQQKFASNVVEKCLSFGTPVERQTLVTEMLGSTDENEPLQAMMKDQFANYVVQKVLETCDDHQLELILTRIKVHLNALKKYTYGKHIVARVEKLVAAGERRISIMAPHAHPA